MICAGNSGDTQYVSPVFLAVRSLQGKRASPNACTDGIVDYKRSRFETEAEDLFGLRCVGKIVERDRHSISRLLLQVGSGIAVIFLPAVLLYGLPTMLDSASLDHFDMCLDIDQCSDAAHPVFRGGNRHDGKKHRCEIDWCCHSGHLLF